MVVKNGKAPARCKSASSSSKPKRSMAVPKNLVSCDNGKATDELDGNIVCTQGGTLESKTGDRVLETPGISETVRGEDLPSGSIELAAKVKRFLQTEEGKKKAAEFGITIESTESTELTAITLHQPWASLIAKGYKQYETRDWPTNHRGLIAIHAGRKPKGKQELREHDKVLASFKDLLNEDCPYSSIIALAQLTDVVCMTEEFINQQTETELRCGDWKVGRYAFKLENIRAIAPIPATGKQGLWKFDQEAAGFDSLHLEPWNPADFGKVQHKAEADGQLNLLEFDSNEPPEPDDYPGDLEAKKAYLAWVELQEGTAEEEYQHTTAEEIWNQSGNGNGSICAQELGQGSPTPGLNVGDDRPTSLSNGTNIASQFSDEDSPTVNDLAISKPWTLGQANLEAEELASSQQVLPANHLLKMEIDSLPKTIETASPQSLPLSINCSPNLQSLKMLPDSLIAQNGQEATSFILLESLTSFPKAGTMSNGNLLVAPILEAPGAESELLLLRSPGALSNLKGRPPGKTRLESQLNQLGLISDGEVAAPEFLELGYQLPIGWTNPQENRTALELAQVQAQQSSIVPSSESQAEMETTAIEEQPWAMPLTGELQQLPLSGLNISPASPLPDNIGSFTKEDLLEFAIAAHRSISDIQKSELELAMRKLNQARIAGTCLAEYKKKCRHGEFESSIESNRINVRTAQTYMSIAKNWHLLTEASRETVLEDGQVLGINWARDTIAQSKKSLKSAAAPANPNANAQSKKSLKSVTAPANPNAKHIAAATVPVVEEVQEVPAVPTTITSVKEEQEVMAADFGLRTNGKTLLPDVAVNDRAMAEQLDPYTVDDRPFAIQVESVEVDDSKWYEETAIGVVSRTEGFTTNQSAEIINKLLKADFKSRTRATLKKLSKEELADLLRYCDQELDNRK